jgi:hypothetical protein
MGYSYKTYSETKDVMKKYVNATEGAIIYSIIHLQSIQLRSLHRSVNVVRCGRAVFRMFLTS